MLIYVHGPHRRPLLLAEPPAGRRVSLEELEQLLADLPLPAGRLVRAVVFRGVALFPRESIGPLRRAGGPQIRPPTQPRGLDRALGGVEIQVGLALDLLFDEPLDRESRLQRVRLGVQAALGVAAVGAARKVDEFQVREPLMEDLNDALQRNLNLCAVGLRTHRARKGGSWLRKRGMRGGSGDPPRKVLLSLQRGCRAPTLRLRGCGATTPRYICE